MASKISTDNNPSTSKPTQRELDWISKKAGDNWRSLLTNLGVDLDVIMGYHSKYNGNTVNACFEGLVFWVKGNTEEPVSHETLVKALKDANLSSCATTLEEKLRTTLLRHRPGAMEQADTKHDCDLIPTIRATQGETTPVASTTEGRSQDKIKKIVEMYRSGDYNVRVPEIPELGHDFRDLMVKLDYMLASADPQVIRMIRSNVRMEYRTYIYGWKPVELPAVPETPSGLYDFIAAKSTPYEVPLVSCAVQVLKVGTLTKTFQAYKSKLADGLREKLHSCKMRNVTLPKCKDYTHLAAVVSRDKDLVLISLALHIKEYLMKYLQLEETMFEGFGEGCTVLFFSILRINAVLLAPKILSHSAELKRLFDITHLVVFDHFACDLERATIELPTIQRDLEGKESRITQLERVLQKKENEIQRLQEQCQALQNSSWSGRVLTFFGSSNTLSGGSTAECEDELFALAYKDGVKDKYMCHIFEKSESHGTELFPRYTTTQLHMVITYSTSHWSQIVQKYCKPDCKDRKLHGGDENWKLRTEIRGFAVKGNLITTHMPESSGPTWSCTFDGINKVPTSSLDFTKMFPSQKGGPRLLEQAVKSSLYPPKIHLIASSDVNWHDEYTKSRLINLEITGSSPRIHIPVLMVDWVESGMREQKKISKHHSDREAHEEESSSEGHSSGFSSPSMTKRMQREPEKVSESDSDSLADEEESSSEEDSSSPVQERVFQRGRSASQLRFYSRRLRKQLVRHPK